MRIPLKTELSNVTFNKPFTLSNTTSGIICLYFEDKLINQISANRIKEDH